MGRRSRYKRKEIRVTDEWVESFVRPQLSGHHDIEILRFILSNKIATSQQIGDYFWHDTKNKKKRANVRLRKLYDLHCIDRYFPPIDAGSSLQHIVLDSAGAKILGVYDQWRKIRELPQSYRHHILMTEYRLHAKLAGFGWGEREMQAGNVRPDLYYPEYNLAVEIDTGTESFSVLRNKAKRYNRSAIKSVVFVTAGSERRFEEFARGLYIRKAGCQIDQLKELLERLHDWK